MYIYIYAHICIHLYIYMYISSRVTVYSTFGREQIFQNFYHAGSNSNASLSVLIYNCMYTYIYIYKYTWIYTCIYTRIYTYIYVHVHMYIYLHYVHVYCIYIYIYMHIYIYTYTYTYAYSRVSFAISKFFKFFHTPAPYSTYKTSSAVSWLLKKSTTLSASKSEARLSAISCLFSYI